MGSVVNTPPFLGYVVGGLLFIVLHIKIGCGVRLFLHYSVRAERPTEVTKTAPHFLFYYHLTPIWSRGLLKQIMGKELKASDVRFLMDSTDDKDGAKEVIMDYVISWMLRRAQNICKDEKPILYSYCRKFLGKLIGKSLTDDDIVEVETWKQFARIDLWVYVKVGNEEHDILIEDKYYTGVHGNQLVRYKEVFDCWVKGHRANSKKHYWLLTCYDNKKSTDLYKDVLKGSGFKALFWDDMLEVMGLNVDNPVMSESDIFNEFWLEKWV